MNGDDGLKNHSGPGGSFWKSPSAVVLIAFLAIAGFLRPGRVRLAGALRRPENDAS